MRARSPVVTAAGAALLLAAPACKQVLGLEDPVLDGAVGRSAYADLIVSDGPLSYWRLGESAGTAAFDSMPSAVHGTYEGGVTLGARGALAGDADTAVHLDGSGFVSMGDSFDFDGAASFTLEAWASPSSAVTDYAFVIGKENDYGSGRQGYNLWLYATGAGFERLRDDQHDLTDFTDGPLPAGTFGHLVATFDGSELALYVDGVRRSSEPGEGIALLDNDESFVLGASNGGAYGRFTGALDEVAVYDRALSAEEIAAHHEAGAAP